MRVLRTAALLLAALPAAASVFDQFSDIGQMTDHLLSGGPGRDGIPAMTNPQFIPADEATWVRDQDLVVGVVHNGVAKTYPENLGWWHEIVNDEIGGEFISVTLCPLTGTPQVFNATSDDGEQIEFGVSGLLINSNLVMYDRRDNETLYPQMIFTGINGRFKGERLELMPAIETTFKMWKMMYPEAQVAQFGTGLERYSKSQSDNYQNPDRFGVYPYSDYRTNDGYFIAPLSTGRPDLTTYFAKEVVTGICVGEALRAYPFADMAPQAVVNDTLGGQELLVVFDLASRTSIPYDRNVGGQLLTFYQVEAEGHLPVEFMDVETRSRWDILGNAISGPLVGQKLTQLPAHNSMWFAWSTYWQKTTVWEIGDGIIEAPPEMTAVLEPAGAAVPDGFELTQNFPNPFNPDTRIRFTLPIDGQMSLQIYNTAGQLVRSLAEGTHRAGFYDVTWDGTDDAGRRIASGTYLYHLEMETAGYSESRRMTLTR
ncbi:MAG: DUF3179 domain-containing (seleno)protein [Candidatus Latescibacteria bacterium]|jgi:hypothetical protein|nr:hypothetical protein [Gemmatimonadaceae bacterium]MDP6015255.1 DUF3179 domain-containing (seleno)protein [Candidatus Latescibacterota bacterium]MDP7447408.1 DUF3179 domain-containing (seleno)protein [Candidatus Latescibacterota bacterium]HJP31651.1 DUF3179 domain-containing (seleno)protein [Candidatus Latescibacterota bacterium]